MTLQKLEKPTSNEKPISNMDSKNTLNKCDSNDKDENDEPIDSPQALYGLMKSNSVSARASMWQQLQMQANKGLNFLYMIRIYNEIRNQYRNKQLL